MVKSSGADAVQSINLIAVVPPTIETADQLLHPEPKRDHVQLALSSRCTESYMDSIEMSRAQRQGIT